MKIHNIRMGLATNSSSTHSLILMSPSSYKKATTDEYNEFGWGYFTAANKTSKENYLGLCLMSNLARAVGHATAAIVVEGLFPNREDFSGQIKEGYVDHQSVLTFPASWGGKGIDVEFFKAFRDYVVNNPVAILGGNDNGDGPSGHPLWSEGGSLPLRDITDRLGSNLVARDDGDYWVLFNRDTGAKLRLSLNSDAPVATKAKAPELVDIKITDFCPFGCEYCYQASTTEGTHAEYKNIFSIAKLLAKLKVFEVAIGGGEPTLHPDFIRILKDFRYFNIVPNFTTRNLAWLNDEEKAKLIFENSGAFAVSVSTRDDVNKLWEALQKFKVNRHNKVSIQFVLESGGDLEGVLEEAKKNYLRVTLLGFKTTGFGKDFPTLPEDWIETVLKVKGENGYMNLGVDTAIVQQYGESIKKRLGVRDELVTAEEGKFSMYIDAVSGRMAPSSYCDESLYEPLPTPSYTQPDYAAEEIKKAFTKW